MKKFKTIQARANQLIRERNPAMRPKYPWIRATIDANGVRQELGTGGFALTENNVTHLWKNKAHMREPAHKLVLAYWHETEGSFSDGLEITVFPEEIL